MLSTFKFLIGFVLEKAINTIDFILLYFYKGRDSVSLIKQLKPQTLRPSELLTLYSISKYQSNIAGDYAEVGVYRGTSAETISKGKKDKPLHLFDTFESFPELSNIDYKVSSLERKYFTPDYQKVKERLSKYPNINFYKGFFPKTAESVKDKKFAFVHLDADLYQATLDGLNFFWPRMTKGGIIVIHDRYLPAVKKALEQSKLEVIELPISQCMIIK